MSWEAIGEPKLELPAPGELSLQAPTHAWPHVVGAAAANGRVALPLGYARTTRFVCELPEGPPVLDLLALGERVLAIRAPGDERRQRVELIDPDGRHLHGFEGSHGDWALDLRFAMLLGRSLDGQLVAWSLEDPSRPPILVFNRLNGRELDELRFVDGGLVTVTRPAKVLGGPPPDVLVDVVHVPNYAEVSRWRSLRSSKRVAERIAEGLDRVVLGFDPAGLILAGERELWWGDWYLRPRASLELGPELLPLQIAPRGDGSGWMLAEREGQAELWQLVVGRCVQDRVVSSSLIDASSLLVAPDDGVVLVGSSEVASFDPEGAPRWAFGRAGRATGLIDPHGVTLYSDAGSLISTDAAGARATVWIAPEGVTRLGPLAATASRLWVGAGRLVYGLV